MTSYKLIALTGIVLAASFGSSKQSAAQSSTITAFYTAHVVSMSPMWIANETGLFKKHGADVRLVYIGSGPIGTTSIFPEKRILASLAALLRYGRFSAVPRTW